MRIATFNINNVVKRLANLLAWLDDTRPDVVCLQELKCADAAFPAAELEAAGYGAVWAGQRTWNGVAILARDATPIVTRYELPGDPADAQARYIEAAVRGVLVASIYAPNGNPNPGPKFAYKLAWLQRLTAHAAELRASGAPVALVGDYNVVPTEADIYQPNSWAGDALVDPAARAAFARLLAQGWTDALLAAHAAANSGASSPPLRSRGAKQPMKVGAATRAQARAGGGLPSRSSPAAKTAGEVDRRAPARRDGGGARPAQDDGGGRGPNGVPWTFWSYLRRRWENDKGLRIDHLLLTPDLADRLTAAGVDRSVRGHEGASDHVPTWIDLADA